MTQIEGLDDAVAKLRKSAESLNKTTDSIAKTVSAVEDFLNRVCSAGVYAHARFELHEDLGMAQYKALVYTRVAGKYRVAVEQGDYLDHDEKERTTAWAECSRDLKLESAKKLPGLILKIAEALDLRIHEAEETELTVSSVLATLKQAGA